MTDDARHRFELDTFHRNVLEEDLIADLKRVAGDLGKQTITFREYREKGKYHSSTVALRFGSWLAALEKSGLKKTVNYNISVDELFENCVDQARKAAEIQGPDARPAYAATTYASRFGGWRNALTEFVAWANDQNVPVKGADQQADLRTRKTPRSVNWRFRAQVLVRDGATCRLRGATPASGARLHVAPNPLLSSLLSPVAPQSADESMSCVLPVYTPSSRADNLPVCQLGCVA